MTIEVREMILEEFSLVTSYFHGTSPQHLENMSVDPEKLPPAIEWLCRLEEQLSLPHKQKSVFYTLWCIDGTPMGFSSIDSIVFGEKANLHLHMIEESERNVGHGRSCVERSAHIYFKNFELRQLYCQPNAFNVAPNRALQRAGFKYLKTFYTVPGPLNMHQAITQWVINRNQVFW